MGLQTRSLHHQLCLGHLLLEQMHHLVQQQHGRLLDQGKLHRMNRNERFLLCHRSYLSGIYRGLLHVEPQFFDHLDRQS